MHIECKRFTLYVKKYFPEYFINSIVLDVGGGDINGNNRELFYNCIYNSNDLIQAPNVTVVSKTKDLSFKSNYFDTIISTECFEHDAEYKESLLKIYDMLKPNGLFCFTCASTGRPEHGTRRTTSFDSYGTIGNVENFTDYYKNLTEIDLNDVLNLNDLFITWDTYYNGNTKDLYFYGIKKDNIIFDVKREIPIYNDESVFNTKDIITDLQKYSSIEFVNSYSLKNMEEGYKTTYPFPHIVMDNFFKVNCIENILTEVNKLNSDNADRKFLERGNEYNKYAFTSSLGDILDNVFIELNSKEFISYIEKLTGIQDIIYGDTTLLGAGVHRIHNEGYLKMHTDFNCYEHPTYGKLDRRINLLIYLNPNWKEEYNGHLLLGYRNSMTITNKILPILNRCVIFNTSNSSIHGHPIPLNTFDEAVYRQSIAVYYYTKNVNGEYDFEGDREHSTIWFGND
jgi:Rps23 Pro-64 3,4-dihydroxylase Tpa1-like proline 4-hydroxylase